MKYIFLVVFLLSCDSTDTRYESNAEISEMKQGLERASKSKRARSTALNIRGGRSDQTSYVIDGIVKDESIQRKLIKKAYLTLNVAQLDSANVYVDQILRGLDAYISSSNEYKDYRRRYNNLTIRIKSDGFDSVINQLSGIAKNVDSRRVNVDDVTEQYVDTKIRLKNKKAVQVEYLRLLKKAKSVKDILSVQRELRQIREEIEAKEGLLKFYDHQISYSTIELNLYQDIKFGVVEQNSFLQNVANAFYQGYQSFLNLVLSLIELWIYLLMLLIVILAYKNWKRKKK